MKEKYLYIFLLLIITSFSAQAQTAKNSGVADQVKTENTLDKVQIYPNPVTSGKIYINAENTSTKTIELYDMLGKRIVFTEMNGYQKELNVSNLKAGVYILKLSEKNNSITRKIVIK
ncbi:Por secretion system C-terminal sorting domain-containing protein [Paenimyroides ummariense]|uniref:Por secretion system C-terminal sorting domain-containing protein n=1 Tax=Paenimyroides ummariense TaxID=913024 RepID=A0A1I4WE01_9FLAO|nr:T9SS type A sorting domain-containing protein [Paenimyroides ummariense]SFN11625.1 Por secretion system C-terminal sorting domain-containing protein [Paenimyroides ummariense]